MASCSRTTSAMEMGKAMRKGGRNRSMREIRGGGGEVCHICFWGTAVPGMVVGLEVERFIATSGLLSAILLREFCFWEAGLFDIERRKENTKSVTIKIRVLYDLEFVFIGCL
jgi:hypothetical protein